jgi:hypothetical protein
MILKIGVKQEGDIFTGDKSRWMYLDNIAYLSKHYFYSIRCNDDKVKELVYPLHPDDPILKNYGVFDNQTARWIAIVETAFMFDMKDAIRYYEKDKKEEVPLIALYVTFNNGSGKTFILLGDFETSYILNDQGKTIEKIF